MTVRAPDRPAAEDHRTEGGAVDAGYMKELDGLRGVALFLVVISHFPPHKFIEEIMPWGVLGVELFFTLSGFLITGILLRGRDIAERGEASRGSVWRAFYGRRILRIFPVYYLTLLILYLANLCQVRPVIWYQVTYLINFLIASTGLKIGDTTHFWSLAVEEQFYLVWPWIILLLPYRWLLRVLILCVLSAPLYRLVTGFLHWNVYASNWVPIANFDTLCGGALLALMSHRPELRGARDRITRIGLPLGTLGLTGFLIANALHKTRYGLTVVGLGCFYTPLFFGLVDRAAQGRTGRWATLLEWPPLVYLGQISYCVYILHLLMPGVFDRIAAVTGLPWLAASPVGAIRLFQMMVPTILIAAASRRWFEKPLLRYKKLFPYQRRRMALPAPQIAGSPANSGR